VRGRCRSRSGPRVKNLDVDCNGRGRGRCSRAPRLVGGVSPGALRGSDRRAPLHASAVQGGRIMLTLDVHALSPSLGASRRGVVRPRRCSRGSWTLRQEGRPARDPEHREIPSPSAPAARDRGRDLPGLSDWIFDHGSAGIAFSRVTAARRGTSAEPLRTWGAAWILRVDWQSAFRLTAGRRRRWRSTLVGDMSALTAGPRDPVGLPGIDASRPHCCLVTTTCDHNACRLVASTAPRCWRSNGFTLASQDRPGRRGGVRARPRLRDRTRPNTIFAFELDRTAIAHLATLGSMSMREEQPLSRWTHMLLLPVARSDDRRQCARGDRRTARARCASADPEPDARRRLPCETARTRFPLAGYDTFAAWSLPPCSTPKGFP